jgi:hypothetical protein
MIGVSPDELQKEFKQYLKKTRLAEQEKNRADKAAIVMKQIKKLLGDQDE